MVVYRVWSDFSADARELARTSDRPVCFVNSSSSVFETVQVRFTTKWRHQEGLLVVKITDDFTCLTFRIRSSILLNRFDALTRQILLIMANKPEALPMPAAPEPAAATSAIPTEPSIAVASQAPSKASAKKKKKKGKR